MGPNSSLSFSPRVRDLFFLLLKDFQVPYTLKALKWQLALSKRHSSTLSAENITKPVMVCIWIEFSEVILTIVSFFQVSIKLF